MANIKKNQTAKIPTKSGKEYSYQYVDIAKIHEYLEKNNITYYQYVEPVEGKDYIMTVPIIDGVEQKPRRGVQIVDATLYGNDNPAQKQGSATTYARRYSLLMAFGLATEDDDANSLGNGKKEEDENTDTITETEAKSVYSLMLRKGYEIIPTLEEYFGVKNTKNLTRQQYMEIVNHCKTLPDKK